MNHNFSKTTINTYEDILAEDTFEKRLRLIENELPDLDDINFHHQITNAILIFFYTLLAIISLIGNGLVCRVLLIKKQSLSPISTITTGTSRMLIVNLAISDLLLTTFNIPMNLVRFVSHNWPFGPVICTMMPFVQSVSAYCSAWTMMIIAFERYQKLFHSGTMIRLQNLYKQQQQNRSRKNNEIQMELHSMNAANTNNNIISIDSTANTNRNEVWKKLSPNFYQTSYRCLSYIPYYFCINCCCCCPLVCMPKTPPLSSSVSRIKHQGISYTASPVSVPITCSKHLKPITIIGIIWTISLILSIPHSLFSRIVHYDYLNMTRCTINAFPNEQAKRLLTIYTLCSQYILPIGLTSFCYLHIGIFLWRRQNIGSLSEQKRRILLRKKRKRVQLLIIVVGTFAICWLPLNLYVLLTELDIISHHLLLFFLVHWFAMSSVCYNPFIYCWLNEIFRQKIAIMLKCLLWKPYWIIMNHLCCFITKSTLKESRIDRSQHPSFRQYKLNGWRLYRNNLTSTAPVVNGSAAASLVHDDNGAADRVDKPDVESWNSSTGYTTGQQYVLSELMTMPPFGQQHQMQQEHRPQTTLAILDPEPITKTTSINLVSSDSSSLVSGNDEIFVDTDFVDIINV